MNVVQSFPGQNKIKGTLENECTMRQTLRALPDVNNSHP